MTLLKVKVLLRSIVNRFLVSFVLFSTLFTFSNQIFAIDILTTARTFANQSFDRRVGIEVEFSGLTLKKSLELIAQFTEGKVTKREKKIYTTLKEKTSEGLIYNEAFIPEWLIETKDFGRLILKIDNNQKNDDSELSSEDEVIELVTEPIRRSQVLKLQKLIDILRKGGARGTADNLPVSIQINTEINEGEIESVNWQQVVSALQVYFTKSHRNQIDLKLEVPSFRKEYLKPYSQGLIKRIMNKNYRPSAREFYDDFIYRQSLEFLGFNSAWTKPIDQARKTLLNVENPIVPTVVKQNVLRVSSLLMMDFPEDPMSQLYLSSGWAVPMPILEWREFNNDFDVWTHYQEVIGLMGMIEKYGYFDHDTLLNQLSGLSIRNIQQIQDSTLTIKDEELNSNLVIFRYLLGDANEKVLTSDKSIVEAYGSNLIGKLPFYSYGTHPAMIPGNSIVMHRNQFHRNSVIGKYNPILVNGFIMQALENKYVEMLFWNHYVKEGIPKTILLNKVLNNSKEISNAEDLLNLVHRDEKLLINFVLNIRNKLNSQFPKGWVLKGLFDLSTEKEIISDLTNWEGLIKQYLKSDFDLFRKKMMSSTSEKKYSPDLQLEHLKSHRGYKGWKILQLLNNNHRVLVQERFDIAREFRVEIVAGQVIGNGSTVDRYKYLSMHDGKIDSDYQSPKKDEYEKVEAFSRRIISSLPRVFQNMSFGFDVAILKNGQLVLIESNPGANSSFLYEEEAESIRALTQFLSDYPKLLETGMIPSGLSAGNQLRYLKQMFAVWGVSISDQYPGMVFTDHKIKDKEFNRLKSVQFGESAVWPTKVQKQSQLKCQGVLSK